MRSNRSNRSKEQRRRDYLHKRRRLEGKLVCLYCGRDDLIVGPTDDPELELKIATIDHLEPRNGLYKTATGKRDNWVICCKDCNNAKDNLTVEEFAAVKEQIIIPWDWREYLRNNDPEEYKRIINDLKKTRRDIKAPRHCN